MHEQIDLLSHSKFCDVSENRYKTKVSLCIGQGSLKFEKSDFTTLDWREIMNVFLLRNSVDDLYFVDSQAYSKMTQFEKLKTKIQGKQYFLKSLF